MDTFKTAKPDPTSLQIVIGLQCIILIALILFRLLYEPFLLKPEPLVYPFCCLLFGMLVWSFYSWHLLTKSLFNPYLIFLTSAFLFNGGQALLKVFNLGEEELLESYDFQLSQETILQTLFLVTLCLTTFHLSALISLAQAKFQKFDTPSAKEELRFNSKTTYIVGWRLLCICFLPAVHVISNNLATVIASGYGGLYENWGSGWSGAPDLIAAFLIPSSLFLLAGSENKPKVRWLVGSIIITFSMTKFFSGERNQAVMPLISFAWLWHTCIHPLPAIFLLSIASAIMFVALPLIAMTRTTAGEDRLSISYLMETFSSIDNPFIASISEMGGSMMTVAHTIDLVPSVRDFQWGLDYFYALLTLLPNIFGGRHPTIVRGLAEKWLVAYVNPDFAFDGGTYGFSFIAEAYLNFGWVGAPIALGVIGFLYTRLILWAVTSNDPAKIAMVASYLSFFLFFARAESAFVFRSLVWYSLLPYLWVRIVRQLRLKKLAK